MQQFNTSHYEFGFHDKLKPVYSTQKGLTEKTVREISSMKQEPEWMLGIRLKALALFFSKKLPTWGGDLTRLNFDEIYYYVKPTDKQGRTWDEVPKEIKDTFDKIGIPQAERKFLAGVAAQYDSEVVYHSISKMLEAKGVIFVDTDTALKKYPDLLRQYFGKIIPPADNKLAALNTAVWSGGSCIYVPKNVCVDLPLQAYFRINAKNMGQFERTLIIADEGSYVHYVEGCTAPIFTTDSLHSAVVEILVKKGARVRYTTIQNWSKNVYNLVTKRMFVEEEGFGEWIDGNLGSQLTMKYPSVYLMGRKARGEVLSLAFAGEDQHQDAGGKAIHFAPETSSVISSKSVSKDGGRTSYRGLLKVLKGAENSKSTVRCDALILDPKSRSDTYPTMEINEEKVTIGHEAAVSKIGEDQLFYFRSRGISQAAAEVMIVNGFIEPIVRELPMEYAVELNRLIQLEMTGAVG
ncbi:MAG: Fe-S cluster assembly protein SufB [Candidatus Levybacteria bacterium RIFCSPHIGHO2_02_FULL_37_18]|nr:MAG: Fe-S cluster assembly protein SufB [Candidatus Levybacteria bacterium RIFCSPHIGHO2_01_FULL_38_12]OGH21901.1 MAG: Fe-S cluster assembly protein SufB [Candidatus Levybacteria bacterium RIFCSPHIGHO2_02_FULL_37_18]OGH33558.1 MAG: Fe-S cluster assembly protein SufB [Candidatus Levybacteria bacterium RIFCSPLOWO2_01_FULL_37_20]OGH44479.1 MAG: Fe-S cluster assembly protein SufB [Candidatus Levybacteria bacterium RIFCSPLOWO2_02_FULL_37_18]OGH52430.1 MAG: Fe-S cluster assembly protein SufB [Candi